MQPLPSVGATVLLLLVYAALVTYFVAGLVVVLVATRGH